MLSLDASNIKQTDSAHDERHVLAHAAAVDEPGILEFTFGVNTSRINKSTSGLTCQHKLLISEHFAVFFLGVQFRSVWLQRDVYLLCYILYNYVLIS